MKRIGGIETMPMLRSKTSTRVTFNRNFSMRKEKMEKFQSGDEKLSNVIEEEPAGSDNFMVDIHLNKYINMKNLAKKLKSFDKLKEKVTMSRKAELFQLCDLANCANVSENLKKLMGFFMVQKYLVRF